MEKMNKRNVIKKAKNYKKGYYSDPYVCSAVAQYGKFNRPIVNYEGIQLPLNIAFGLENIKNVIDKIYKHKIPIDSSFIQEEFNKNSKEIAFKLLNRKLK